MKEPAMKTRSFPEFSAALITLAAVVAIWGVLTINPLDVIQNSFM
jgi:hypothetical protein